MNNTDNEIWLPVNGYEGIYEVSNFGKIKSLPRITKSFIRGAWLIRNEPERIMSAGIKTGYRTLRLWKDGEFINTKTSVIVAKHFVPNPLNKPCVNHIDGNKLNDHYTNLEWVTHSENTLHAYRIGLKVPLKKELWEKNLIMIKDKYVQCLCTGRIIKTKEALTELNLSSGYFSKMINDLRPNWTNFIHYDMA